MILHNRLRFMHGQRSKLIHSITAGVKTCGLKLPVVPTWSIGVGQLDFKRFDYDDYCINKRNIQSGNLSGSFVASMMLENNFKSPFDELKPH